MILLHLWSKGLRRPHYTMRKPDMNPLLNGLTLWFSNCDMQNPKTWGTNKKSSNKQKI